MNIAIEDIKFLERKYNDVPGKGMVMSLAEEGKDLWEIDEIMERLKNVEK